MFTSKRIPTMTDICWIQLLEVNQSCRKCNNDRGPSQHMWWNGFLWRNTFRFFKMEEKRLALLPIYVKTYISLEIKSKYWWTGPRGPQFEVPQWIIASRQQWIQGTHIRKQIKNNQNDKQDPVGPNLKSPQWRAGAPSLIIRDGTTNYSLLLYNTKYTYK